MSQEYVRAFKSRTWTVLKTSGYWLVLNSQVIVSFVWKQKKVLWISTDSSCVLEICLIFDCLYYRTPVVNYMSNCSYGAVLHVVVA